ncbi:MAG: hypothetical protein FE78DRAFT_26565 [Acidomyces sp. 'richmondensis']|nr:MAG: hypothetical protein FE78DRAFT_26565 [Acidomyces sp. 'richmondensis']
MQQSGGGPLHLPGFFYDTEKRKYFRIQADHQAPANAKYSASQVARGERETKKRRSAVEDEQVRSRQTVRRSAALLDPQTGGIGLAREIGIHKSSESRSERDAAFVAGLQPATLRVTPPNDTCEQGSLFDVATSFSDIGFRQRGTHYLLGYNHMFGSSVHDALYDRDQAWEPLTSTPGLWDTVNPKKPEKLVSFRSALVGIHLIDNFDFDHLGYFVVTNEPTQPGNVYYGYQSLEQDVFQASYLSLDRGGPGSGPSVLASSYNSLNLAVSSTCKVSIIDHSIQVTHSLHNYGGSSAIGWLDQHTVTFSHRKAKAKNASHGCKEAVVLWDIRSGGISERFYRRGHTTGILAADDSGLHLLVSNNKLIDLYDMRMNKEALISFNHEHQGPKLQFDCLDGSIVAALDRDNHVQTYSLRTGRRLHALPDPLPDTLELPSYSSTRILMNNLRWRRDIGTREEKGARSFELQACYGNNIVRWKFYDPSEVQERSASSHEKAQYGN